eukprot:m.1422490 g.1422490  ORF g.1422490 m.1422490 type:complete len:117 (+) comp25050_c2_seq4:1710-2060(+)
MASFADICGHQAPAVAIAPISHIVQLFGVAISVGNFNIPPQGTPVPPLATALMDAPALHIVMERLVCDGDVHEVIHCDDSWECVRSRGRDTVTSNPPTQCCTHFRTHIRSLIRAAC